MMSPGRMMVIGSRRRRPSRHMKRWEGCLTRGLRRRENRDVTDAESPWCPLLLTGLYIID